jgi:hypothetical protein
LRARMCALLIWKGAIEMPHLSTDMAVIFVITFLAGGGAAWMTGRAVALSWQSLWRAWVWLVPLAAGVRFLHFSLFRADLFEPAPFAFDYFILAAATSFGYALTRYRQMKIQYSFQRPAPGKHTAL